MINISSATYASYRVYCYMSYTMLVANSRGAINWLVVYRIWAAPFEMSSSRLRQTMLPSPRDKSKSESMGGIQSYIERFFADTKKAHASKYQPSSPNAYTVKSQLQS